MESSDESMSMSAGQSRVRMSHQQTFSIFPADDRLSTITEITEPTPTVTTISSSSSKSHRLTDEQEDTGEAAVDDEYHVNWVANMSLLEEVVRQICHDSLKQYQEAFDSLMSHMSRPSYQIDTEKFEEIKARHWQKVSDIIINCLVSVLVHKDTQEKVHQWTKSQLKLTKDADIIDQMYKFKVENAQQLNDLRCKLNASIKKGEKVLECSRESLSPNCRKGPLLKMERKLRETINSSFLLEAFSKLNQ